MLKKFGITFSGSTSSSCNPPPIRLSKNVTMKTMQSVTRLAILAAALASTSHAMGRTPHSSATADSAEAPAVEASDLGLSDDAPEEKKESMGPSSSGGLSSK
jgi:hypothetical protein